MDDDLELVELSDAELATYAADLEASYADEMHRLGGYPLEEARERSRKSMAELFPSGRPAEGSAVWRAIDNAGEQVGVLWLAQRHESGSTFAWIYDVEVVQSRRGQGHGRRLMEHAERLAREWGASTLRLNVFGDNEVARNLYRRQGFREQNVIMSKEL
jgi:ribosomal protein S18 acetylase RimI-like enzyme